MKKNIYSIFAIIALTLLISVDVMAMDKLVMMPTADLMGNKGFISGEVIDSDKRILEGVYNLNSSTAVGGVITFVDDKYGDDTEIGVLAKTILAPENDKQPAISAGLRQEDVYLVASKNLGYGFRGHFGVGNGGFGGLFLGFNKVLNPVSVSEANKPSLPIINLMGEYIDEKVNFAVQMNLQENMKFSIGLVDMDELKVGLGYLF